MKTSTWAKRLKRLMTEAEMPFYPDTPQVTPSVPVNVDVEVLKSLLNWAVGSSPEQIDRAVAKVENLAASGAVIDSNAIADITVAGDYEMPMMGEIPPVETPTASPMAPAEPIPAPEGSFDGASMGGSEPAASSFEPEGEEPIDGGVELEEPTNPEGEEDLLNVPTAGSGEEELEEPTNPEGEEGEEDEDEEVKKTFFNSFFK